ncbi:hypothetical protein AOQ71_12555 [Bradyrhizobium manausense]|uniref:Uncharacterized protein n=1 Tax=Bradyrhizobium manausense TaxID=989370 RepID=A0A0R3DXS7_9BRAD|nr:hypothetical protein AOQ71_12555 [Bradyrhizobium manausense]
MQLAGGQPDQWTGHFYFDPRVGWQKPATDCAARGAFASDQEDFDLSIITSLDGKGDQGGTTREIDIVDCVAWMIERLPRSPNDFLEVRSKDIEVLRGKRTQQIICWRAIRFSLHRNHPPAPANPLVSACFTFRPRNLQYQSAHKRMLPATYLLRSWKYFSA